MFLSRLQLFNWHLLHNPSIVLILEILNAMCTRTQLYLKHKQRNLNTLVLGQHQSLES
jgi:hypothetical protein